MTDTTTTTNETSEPGSTVEDVEAIMKRFAPSEPSAELFARLSSSFEAALLQEELPNEEELVDPSIGDMVPVIVPEDKLNHWARLMDQAAREVTEERLKDLKPVQPEEFRLMRWLMSVENTSADEQEKDEFIPDIPAHKRLKLWAMSAAATFMLILGVLSFYPMEGDVSPLVQKGDINRETIHVVDEGLHWNAEKQVAEKKYHVDYKDTLEVVDRDGFKMGITVPSAQKIAVPVEIY